jgi:uncharacterized protein (DUF362 family)
MSKVAVLKTSPDTIIDDYGHLMDLVGYQEHLAKEIRTVIKLNLSWTLYYPACSTEPWQLEGLVRTLRKDGYKDLIAVENQTVVTHPWKGAYYNKWLPILDSNNIEFRPLTNVKWIPIKPKSTMLAMYEIFDKKSDEILVPEMFVGTNVIHLPTVKTHGHTTTTGAMKDAFGGLIPKYRHHAHKMIHEILVDLLTIQKEIHKGLLAVMDGCVCGNGAGPRVMDPFMGNIILAGEDQVAIDAVSAKIMGFEPLKIDYIKMAHDKGLGLGDVDQIEIVGIDEGEIKALNFGFETKKSLIIKWDQRLRKRTQNRKGMHSFLFHSPIFKMFIFASKIYHDILWYPTIGKKKIKTFRKTQWGKLFESYECGKMPEHENVRAWDPY